MIKNKGFVTVEEMAKLFNVTPQTIRRDINFLDSEGYVSRYHGGAGHSVSTENLAHQHRKELRLNEKKKIDRTVALILMAHCSSCQDKSKTLGQR